MKCLLGMITAIAISAPASAAFAEGAVKVECFGRCDLVNLGQVCDTYSFGSQPVAIACDDTDVGFGITTSCGSVSCRPYGTIFRSDLLSAYCTDGPGYDAVVTCRVASTATLQQPTSPKVDDGAWQPQDSQ